MLVGLTDLGFLYRKFRRHKGDRICNTHGALLYDLIEVLGVERIIKLFEETNNSQVRQELSFGESEVNALGYHLLHNNNIEDAIKIFIWNTQEYPRSANVYDSLGEAYMKAQNKELAMLNYRKSLELDPRNENAWNMNSMLECPESTF